MLSASAADGRRVLAVEPLTSEAFRAWGDVIDRDFDDRSGHAINGATAWRRHDLARIDAAGGGHAAISVVRAGPRALPFRLQCLERHVLCSQAFVAVDAARWLVVVAAGDREPQLDTLRAFVASARQGVSYARGTWHHPLLALDRSADFVVVDRIPDDGAEDCEVRDLHALDLWIVA